MASKPAASSSVNTSQEYVVRVPKEVKKKHSILKFHHNLKTDLTKSGPLKMERENNLKDYKLSYDMDLEPKFGAGSEFGREQREEARRKKYGIYRKKYNPDDQPWLMKLGEGKTAKRFKGTKEGGISDNVSYFIFTQCPDGAFDAYPIDDWYHFNPEIKYKCLSSEEAEEEFIRRDKTLNFFSIMVKKRLKNEDDDDLDEDVKDKKAPGKKGKKKDFLLTELDEWAVMSDGDVEDGSDLDGDDTGKPKKKPTKDKGKKKSKRSMKINSDDEALEESDSFDEANEVDYMTDSESNDEDMYEEKKGDEAGDKYKEQGVEDEEGLKKLMDSEDEEEEEEKKDEEDNEDEPQDAKEKKDDSDSVSSASSESDSDPEKDVNFSSALFMQKKSVEKKKADNEKKNRSRSATPTEEKVKKRKAEGETPLQKKAKMEPTMTPSSSSASLASEGISEESVRRYLLRKPMTTKDLVQKFKNTGLTKEQLVNTIAKILKRIDPEKKKIKDKLYLSIKKQE